MNKIYENIINEGKKNGESIEVINTKLKEAGATFHLNPDGGVAGWTEDEMREGFIPAETEPEDVKHLHDYMKFNPAKANTEEEVWVPEGHYRITFDEGGHPEKAVRVNG
jgi:hypothetical protein|nr:MAG TPA: hypothetical protein [Caudoviricetes sp.]